MCVFICLIYTHTCMSLYLTILNKVLLVWPPFWPHLLIIQGLGWNNEPLMFIPVGSHAVFWPLCYYVLSPFFIDKFPIIVILGSPWNLPREHCFLQSAVLWWSGDLCEGSCIVLCTAAVRTLAGWVRCWVWAVNTGGIPDRRLSGPLRSRA